MTNDLSMLKELSDLVKVVFGKKLPEGRISLIDSEDENQKYSFVLDSGNKIISYEFYRENGKFIEKYLKSSSEDPSKLMYFNKLRIKKFNTQKFLEEQIIFKTGLFSHSIKSNKKIYNPAGSLFGKKVKTVLQQ